MVIRRRCSRCIASWDADAVRDDLRGFVAGRLGDAAGC